ncbi:transcriptional regulator [Micromonospora sicca]|uniref:Transcriptional regulator n=1 Tax=Micromonospora sicca TaxID=2202420 RepID=A0A317DI09_9ACTN|nr:transcriptional regulator [Micromonospora sp. 4G51]
MSDVLSPLVPDSSEPKTRGRRPLKRWQKALIVLLSLVLIGGICGGASALLLIGRYEGKTHHEDILGPIAAPKDEQRWKSGPLDLLLLGSDSREGEPDEGRFGGQRSDTIMLVHLSKNLDRATIVSIPRDSYVYVPPAKGWNGGMNKLNAAFAFGGAPHAAKTITQLTGVKFDGAMIANFASIHKMVEAVDGVRVCIPYTVRSTFSDKVWEKGCHQLDGAAAEEFMRQRKAVPGGDFGRIHDQQLVVKAITEKVAAEGMLQNPLRLDELLVTAADALTIDRSLDLRELALVARDIRPANIKFATVPYTSASLKTHAGSAVKLDDAKAKEMFAAVRDDTIQEWLAAHPQKVPGS